ncbi:hypothetical protein D3C81_1225490 [compost metagenome]
MELIVDESLPSYKSYYEHTLSHIGRLADPENSSSPEDVASAIYDAALDTSDRLRYAIGTDAEQMTQMRYKLGNEAFLSQFRGTFV